MISVAKKFGENVVLVSQHPPELLVGDHPVVVDVRRPDHLVNLGLAHLDRQVSHDKPDLVRSDDSLVFRVKSGKDPSSTAVVVRFSLRNSVPPVALSDLVLRVHVLHEPSHELDELLELDDAAAVHVDLVDHVVHLAVRRVLTHGAQQGRQLLKR